MYILKRTVYLLIFCTALLTGLAPKYSAAMTFNKVTLNDGTVAIKASGPIVKGDSARLAKFLSDIPADEYGFRPMLLESDGGSVAEALRMAAVVDQQRVMTVVGWDAVCASACASIVFLSGDARIIAGNGLLKFHTCMAGGQPSLQCNEGLPNEMLGHGIAHGDLAMLLMEPDPNRFVTYNQTMATCGGLTRWPHESGSGVKFSHCAQASIFGFIVDNWEGKGFSQPEIEAYVKKHKSRVPRGQSPSQFAYDWKPLNVWNVTQLMDGLRSYHFSNLAGYGAVEYSFSCSHDYPGKLFFSIRLLEKKLDLSGLEFIFSSGGYQSRSSSGDLEVQVSNNQGSTEIIVLLPEYHLTSLRRSLVDRYIAIWDGRKYMLFAELPVKNLAETAITASRNCTMKFAMP